MSSRLSDAVILSDVQTVISAVGHTPRVPEFEAKRKELQAKSRRLGEPIALTSYATILRRFPEGWDAALEAVGHMPLGGRRTARARRRCCWYTDAAILEAVNRARRELGDPLTGVAYDSWRRDCLRSDPALAYALPSASTIRKRFGTWRRAIWEAISGPSEAHRGFLRAEAGRPMAPASSRGFQGLSSTLTTN